MIKTVGELIESLEHMIVDDPLGRDKPVRVISDYPDTIYNEIRVVKRKVKTVYENYHGIEIAFLVPGRDTEIISIE